MARYNSRQEMQNNIILVLNENVGQQPNKDRAHLGLITDIVCWLHQSFLPVKGTNKKIDYLLLSAEYKLLVCVHVF